MGEWGSMRWRWAPEAMEGGSPTQRAVCLPGVSMYVRSTGWPPGPVRTP